MATYYCADSDITDLLPTLTGSQIATEAARNIRLRAPATAWVNSVYPGVAPFPGITANGATGWLINGEVDSGDKTAGIDGGTNDPAAADFFTPEGHNAWYMVTAYSSPTLSFRWAEDFNPGVESGTTSGAMADILDNTPLHFGTPSILREACRFYAVSVAYQIIRNNPLDEASAEAEQRAKDLLQVGRDGIARANWDLWYPEAEDAVGVRLSPAYVRLVRG